MPALALVEEHLLKHGLRLKIEVLRRAAADFDDAAGVGVAHDDRARQVGLVGVADVDRNVLEKRAAETEELQGKKPKLYDDYREVIDRKDVDVVIIGTPIDLRRIIDIKQPSVRVTYDLQEIGQPTLVDVLKPFLK